MKLSDILAGLHTLEPYYGEKCGGYVIGAEHDVLYAFATDEPLTRADVEKMHALGWHQEAVTDSNPDNYDIAEGWCAYV